MNKINQSNTSQALLRLFICSLFFTFVVTPSFAEQVNKESSKDSTKESIQSKDTKKKPESSDNASIIKKPIELTKQHKEDLKHYLASEQVKPLLAGPDDYLTLVKKHTSANSKGVVILLPEWQQGATNPKAINYLRNTLPEKGWTTIAVQPNNKPENYPSSATTLDEKIKENEITIKAYKEKLSAMLNAVMNIAQEYPGIVLVIAQGNNAALLVDLYSQEGSQLPNALILLSSYRLSNHDLLNSVNKEFAQQLAFLELPVLDLYLKNDNQTVLTKAAQRKSFAKQEMKVYYRQRQLNNAITGYYPEKELLSQINGWLKAIGW